VPAEHLLDFHDYMHRLQVVHEDVQIWLFYFSLEGIARDWYQSLPYASINSLADFHAAFHVFCKGIFSDDFLFPECCHEFNLLYKDPNIREDFVAVEDTLHYDQEIVDPHFDNHDDAFDIVLNASIKDGCHEDSEVLNDNYNIDTSGIISDVSVVVEDQHVSFEYIDVKEKMFISSGEIDKSASDIFRSAEDNEGSLQFQDLQELKVCSRYKESDGEEEQKGSDQKLSLYFPLTEIKQSTFSIEFCEGNQQHYSQLDQQLKEVFHYDFNDPFANYLESMSSMDVKIVLSEEDCLYRPFKPLFCMIWLPLFFGARSSTMSINQFLTWLHWKHDFT
jgi:hypothetical protein